MTSVIGERSKELLSLRFSCETLDPDSTLVWWKRPDALLEPAAVVEPHLDVAVFKLKLFLCCIIFAAGADIWRGEANVFLLVEGSFS